MSSKAFLHDSKRCLECPCRVYHSEKDKVILGTGNVLYAKRIFILPNYDIRANKRFETLIDILADVYKEVTGEDIVDNNYITREIKCYTRSQYDITELAREYCSGYIEYEIGRIKPKAVICCGDVRDNPAVVEAADKGLRVLYAYSPGCKFYNKVRFESFKKQIKYYVGVSD